MSKLPFVGESRAWSRVARISLNRNLVARAVLSLLVLTSLAGLRADPTPTPASPVPLITKGPIELKFLTVASRLAAPLEVRSPADGSGPTACFPRSDVTVAELTHRGTERFVL